MSFNFNVGKINPAKEKDKEEPKEEETEEYDDAPGIDKNELKLRLIKLAALIGVAVGVLLLLLFIISLFSKKVYKYEEIETIMQKAAISYFKSYPDSLPTNEKQTAQISAATLASTGKMKALSEYTKKGVVCDGKVEIIKRGSEYIYTPYLTCGDDYKTEKLSSLIASSEVVKEGYGLYKVDDSYVYRGELVNNYVLINERLWRIVKLDSNDNTVLVLDGKYSSRVPWDNRYNSELKQNAGNNGFSASRIKESLEAIYNGDILENKKELLDSNTKAHMVDFDLCVGKRALNDSTHNNSTECSSVEKDVKIGLLTVSDYLSASIDSNCTVTNSKACQNYNYLNNRTDFWLATAQSNTSSQVYLVNTGGVVKESTASAYCNARAVIHLNSNTLVKGGTGTEKDPYIIK